MKTLGKKIAGILIIYAAIGTSQNFATCKDTKIPTEKTLDDSFQESAFPTPSTNADFLDNDCNIFLSNDINTSYLNSHETAKENYLQEQGNTQDYVTNENFGNSENTLELKGAYNPKSITYDFEIPKDDVFNDNKQMLLLDDEIGEHIPKEESYEFNIPNTQFAINPNLYDLHYDSNVFGNCLCGSPIDDDFGLETDVIEVDTNYLNPSNVAVSQNNINTNLPCNSNNLENINLSKLTKQYEFQGPASTKQTEDFLDNINLVEMNDVFEALPLYTVNNDASDKLFNNIKNNYEITEIVKNDVSLNSKVENIGNELQLETPVYFYTHNISPVNSEIEKSCDQNKQTVSDLPILKITDNRSYNNNINVTFLNDSESPHFEITILEPDSTPFASSPKASILSLSSSPPNVEPINNFIELNYQTQPHSYLSLPETENPNSNTIEPSISSVKSVNSSPSQPFLLSAPESRPLLKVSPSHDDKFDSFDLNTPYTDITPMISNAGVCPANAIFYSANPCSCEFSLTESPTSFPSKTETENPNSYTIEPSISSVESVNSFPSQPLLLSASDSRPLLKVSPSHVDKFGSFDLNAPYTGITPLISDADVCSANAILYSANPCSCEISLTESPTSFLSKTETESPNSYTIEPSISSVESVDSFPSQPLLLSASDSRPLLKVSPSHVDKFDSFDLNTPYTDITPLISDADVCPTNAKFYAANPCNCDFSLTESPTSFPYKTESKSLNPRNNHNPIQSMKPCSDTSNLTVKPRSYYTRNVPVPTATLYVPDLRTIPELESRNSVLTQPPLSICTSGTPDDLISNPISTSTPFISDSILTTSSSKSQPLSKSIPLYTYPISTPASISSRPVSSYTSLSSDLIKGNSKSFRPISKPTYRLRVLTEIPLTTSNMYSSNPFSIPMPISHNPVQTPAFINPVPNSNCFSSELKIPVFNRYSNSTFTPLSSYPHTTLSSLDRTPEFVSMPINSYPFITPSFTNGNSVSKYTPNTAVLILKPNSVYSNPISTLTLVSNKHRTAPSLTSHVPVSKYSPLRSYSLLNPPNPNTVSTQNILSFDSLTKIPYKKCDPVSTRNNLNFDSVTKIPNVKYDPVSTRNNLNIDSLSEIPYVKYDPVSTRNNLNFDSVTKIPNVKYDTVSTRSNLNFDSLTEIPYVKYDPVSTRKNLNFDSLTEIPYVKYDPVSTQNNLNFDSLTEIPYVKYDPVSTRNNLNFDSLTEIPYVKYDPVSTRNNLNFDSLTEIPYVKYDPVSTRNNLNFDSLTEIPYVKYDPVSTRNNLNFDSLTKIPYVKYDPVSTQNYLNFDSLSEIPYVKYDPVSTRNNLNFDSITKIPYMKYDPVFTQNIHNFDSLTKIPCIKYDPVSTRNIHNFDSFTKIPYVKYDPVSTQNNLNFDSLTKIPYVKYDPVSTSIPLNSNPRLTTSPLRYKTVSTSMAYIPPTRNTLFEPKTFKEPSPGSQCLASTYMPLKSNTLTTPYIRGNPVSNIRVMPFSSSPLITPTSISSNPVSTHIPHKLYSLTKSSPISRIPLSTEIPLNSYTVTKPTPKSYDTVSKPTPFSSYSFATPSLIGNPTPTSTPISTNINDFTAPASIKGIYSTSNIPCTISSASISDIAPTSTCSFSSISPVSYTIDSLDSVTPISAPTKQLSALKSSAPSPVATTFQSSSAPIKPVSYSPLQSFAPNDSYLTVPFDPSNPYNTLPKASTRCSPVSKPSPVSSDSIPLLTPLPRQQVCPSSPHIYSSSDRSSTYRPYTQKLIPQLSLHSIPAQMNYIYPSVTSAYSSSIRDKGIVDSAPATVVPCITTPCKASPLKLKPTPISCYSNFDHILTPELYSRLPQTSFTSSSVPKPATIKCNSASPMSFSPAPMPDSRVPSSSALYTPELSCYDVAFKKPSIDNNSFPISINLYPLPDLTSSRTNTPESKPLFEKIWSDSAKVSNFPDKLNFAQHLSNMLSYTTPATPYFYRIPQKSAIVVPLKPTTMPCSSKPYSVYTHPIKYFNKISLDTCTKSVPINYNNSPRTKFSSKISCPASQPIYYSPPFQNSYFNIPNINNKINSLTSHQNIFHNSALSEINPTQYSTPSNIPVCDPITKSALGSCRLDQKMPCCYSPDATITNFLNPSSQTNEKILSPTLTSPARTSNVYPLKTSINSFTPIEYCVSPSIIDRKGTSDIATTITNIKPSDSYFMPPVTNQKVSSLAETEPTSIATSLPTDGYYQNPKSYPDSLYIPTKNSNSYYNIPETKRIYEITTQMLQSSSSDYTQASPLTSLQTSKISPKSPVSSYTSKDLNVPSKLWTCPTRFSPSSTVPTICSQSLPNLSLATPTFPYKSILNEPYSIPLNSLPYVINPFTTSMTKSAFPSQYSRPVILKSSMTPCALKANSNPSAQDSYLNTFSIPFDNDNFIKPIDLPPLSPKYDLSPIDAAEFQNHCYQSILSTLKNNINKIITPEALRNIQQYGNFTIPLDNLEITQYKPNVDKKNIMKTNYPGIELKSWTSNILLLKPKIVLEATNCNVLNFLPVVRHNNFDLNKVQDIAKEVVMKNYGEPIVLRGKYDDNNSFAVLDDVSNGNNIILWPTYCNYNNS